jgi:hypothetical protein
MLQDVLFGEQRLLLEKETLRKSQFDLIILKHIAQRLQLTLRQLDQPALEEERPLRYDLLERKKRTHRQVLYHYESLFSQEPLPFVGFVSRKKTGLEPRMTTAMDAADNLMLQELAQLSGIISYSSFELRNGDWYNLVVLKSVETKAHIKGSRTHAHAVSHLSPNCYSWIRLHNGLFPQGLSHTEMYLQTTKLYRFYDNQPMPSIQEFMHTSKHQSATQDCTSLHKLV